MQILASLFFLTAFAAAACVILSMVSAYRVRIVAALAGHALVPHRAAADVTFRPRALRDRRTQVRAFRRVQPVALPLIA